MITIAATLRSEPELRQAIATAGMDGVMAITGKSSNRASQDTASLPHTGSVAQQTQAVDLSRLPDLTQAAGLVNTQQLAEVQSILSANAAPQHQSQSAQRYRDAVPVNRFGATESGPSHFRPAAKPKTATQQVRGLSANSFAQQAETKAAAVELSTLLQAMKPGQ